MATAFVELVRHGLPELRRGNDWATLPARHHPRHPSRNSPSPSDAPAAKPRRFHAPTRYRAVDKAGDTGDFLLTAKRDRKAALRFLRKAIGNHGTPKKITIDKSGANAAAIESYNAEQDADIELRQVKYLNNILEQDHRAIKRAVRPTLGFKSFWSAAITLAGIELMHMIRKGQLSAAGKLRPAQQFYSLAG